MSNETKVEQYRIYGHNENWVIVGRHTGKYASRIIKTYQEAKEVKELLESETLDLPKMWG